MATTITKTETLVGKSIRRREDPRLITGTATYVDEIKMPGMHHACILRSPHGAARIHSINTQSALEHPRHYKFRSITADFAGVFANCVPADAYHGAGRQETRHGIERMMDLLADPAAQ